MATFLTVSTSLFVQILVIAVFFGISVILNGSGGKRAIVDYTTFPVSALGAYLMCVFGVSLFDIGTTCRMVVSNNLLQTEFVIFVGAGAITLVRLAASSFWVAVD